MLDDDVLRQLEDQWRRQEIDILGSLAPGLTDPEIERVAAPLGFTLPEEAQRWYRWCGGSGWHNVTRLRVITTLQEDVEMTMSYGASDPNCPDGWLNVMNERPIVNFDCRGGHDDPVPVWHYDPEFAFPTRPVFLSIGEMVAFWADLMRRDVMVCKANVGWTLSNASHTDNERLLGVPRD